MRIKRNTMLEGSIDQEEELKGIKRKELIRGSIDQEKEEKINGIKRNTMPKRKLRLGKYENH